MAELTFNVALGRVNELARLSGASDSLIVVPLEAAGLVDDDTMRDYETLAALLAGASNEQATMGRKTLANVAVSIDHAANRQQADADDVTWTAATGDPIAALVVCYVPTSGAADSAIVPLTKHDYEETPTGSDIVATVSGFFRANG